MNRSTTLFRTSGKRLTFAALLLTFIVASSGYAEQASDDLEWHRITPADVSGQGWKDTAQPFDRLPGRAESIVRPEIWDLARHSSGIYVDFVTNADAISARWTVTSERLAMAHMPASGVSGIDLYIRHQGKWNYLGTGRPKEFPTNTAQLVAGLKPAEAEYRLYTPLYNGVSSVEIGLPKGAKFRITHHDDTKRAPIVVYGTSITQGGCASRPGMSYTAILGRRFGVPVINLGFSGNGKIEPEVAELLAELDASAFVLDPLANLFPEQVGERMPAFVEILRSKHPNTPILLVETPLFPDMNFSAPRSERVKTSNNYLREVFEARRAAGDKNIWLVPACDLTQAGGEGTVDGIHPTDVGFVELATSIEPTLRSALGK